MFDKLLCSLLVPFITSPFYAPQPTYKVVNNSSYVVRATNIATDEEFLIQPYTEWEIVTPLSGFAFDGLTSAESFFTIAVDGSNSRYTRESLDPSDGEYFIPLSGDTAITFDNGSYKGDVYMDLNSLVTDPFSDEFYYLTGLTASNYASLGHNNLFRDVKLIDNGTFFLGSSQYTSLSGSYVNLPYTNLYARYNVSLKGGKYSVENVKVDLSLVATYGTTAQNRKAVVIGGNYSIGSSFTIQNANFGGITYPVYIPIAGDKSYMQMFYGLSNQLVGVNIQSYNAQTDKFLTKQVTLPVDISKTETTDILNDVFSMLSLAFGVIFPFFSIMVFPGVTIGLLILIPLFVALIIALLKLIKK